MGEELDTTSALKTKLFFGVLGTLLSGLCILWILVRIELSNSFKSAVDTPDTGPTSTDTNDLELHNDEDSSEEKDPAPSRRQRRLRWNQKLLLFTIVGILIMMNYLLLVFLPSGMVWLNVLAVLAVMGAFLRCQIADELRRQRLDRLMGILTLFLFIAAFLSLATYARLALQEGSIYRGPARIVGYDETSYSNNEDGDTTRTDLEVAWGGSWACPETNSYCQASVNGALCETKGDGGEDDTDDDDHGRRLEDGGDNNDGDNDNDENDENDQEDQQDEEEELEEENEELEEEVEEEEEENEELGEIRKTGDFVPNSLPYVSSTNHLMVQLYSRRFYASRYFLSLACRSHYV